MEKRLWLPRENPTSTWVFTLNRFSYQSLTLTAAMTWLRISPYVFSDAQCRTFLIMG